MPHRRPLNLSSSLQVIQPCLADGGQALIYDMSGVIVLRSSNIAEVTGALKGAQAGMFAVRDKLGGYEEFSFYIVGERASKSMWKND